MKVTNLRRKLAAALAAGGMLVPSAALAADLNTNLITNPGFEDVDTATMCCGDDPMAVKINGWSAGSHVGFAYNYNLNYDNGGPLAGGGTYYFTPNSATPGDVNALGQVSQDIDVSMGASGTLIASGNAVYSVSGFFSSYLTDRDFGTVHVDFLNGSGSSVGSASIFSRNPDTWTPAGSGGTVPVETATVRVSLFGTAFSGGPDGYMDNVDFRVGNEVILPTLAITVNRDTGGITLANQTGEAVNLSSYVITSAYEGLAPDNWLSITDNYDAGSPGPNQFDAAHDWSELTNPSAHGDLSEADLDSGTGATLAHTDTINLSSNGAWIRTPTEDIVFQYISNGEIVQGIVNYTGNGDLPFVSGDLNTDGAINAADWAILRSNQHTVISGDSSAEAYRAGDLTGDRLNNHADFVAFKVAYEAANGAGSFAALVTAVPEPSSVILLMTAGLLMIPLARRRASES